MTEINRKTARMFSMLGQRGTAGYTLAEIAEDKKNLICMTADLCTTSGLDRFRDAHPDRMINAGIAEQNMVGLAAGLAMDGYQVFASTFATFASMRAVEQLRSMLAYMQLDVKLIGMASGFSMGFFGNTHYSIEDLAITRSIPGLTVLSPADPVETAKAMKAASETTAPCYIRLTGSGNMPLAYIEDYDFQIGKSIELRSGTDICIIATGSMVVQSLLAAKKLESEYGISASVINMHTIKPLDKEAVINAADKYSLIVTAEEHSIIGGLGGAVAEVLAELPNHALQLRIGIDDCFLHPGTYDYLISECGLEGAQIADTIHSKLS